MSSLLRKSWCFLEVDCACGWQRVTTGRTGRRRRVPITHAAGDGKQRAPCPSSLACSCAPASCGRDPTSAPHGVLARNFRRFRMARSCAPKCERAPVSLRCALALAQTRRETPRACAGQARHAATPRHTQHAYHSVLAGLVFVKAGRLRLHVSSSPFIVAATKSNFFVATIFFWREPLKVSCGNNERHVEAKWTLPFTKPKPARTEWYACWAWRGVAACRAWPARARGVSRLVCASAGAPQEVSGRRLPRDGHSVLHPVRPVQPVVTLCSPQARRKDAAGRLRSRASVNNRKDSVKLKRPPDQGDTRRSTRLHDAAIHSSSPPLRGPVFKHGAAVKVLPGRGKADAPACGKPRTSPQKKARATVAGAGGGGEGRVRGQDRRLSPRTPRAQKDRAVCLDERWHEHRDQAPCKEKSMHSLQEVTHITLGSSEFRLDKVFSYSRTASVPRPTAVFHLAALKSLHVGSNYQKATTH